MPSNKKKIRKPVKTTVSFTPCEKGGGVDCYLSAKICSPFLHDNTSIDQVCSFSQRIHCPDIFAAKCGQHMWWVILPPIRFGRHSPHILCSPSTCPHSSSPTLAKTQDLIEDKTAPHKPSCLSDRVEPDHGQSGTQLSIIVLETGGTCLVWDTSVVIPA